MSVKILLNEKTNNKLILDAKKLNKIICEIGSTCFGSKAMGMNVFADKLCQEFDCDDFTFSTNSIYYRNDIRLCSVSWSHEGTQCWGIFNVHIYPEIDGCKKDYTTQDFYNDLLNEELIEYNANMNGKDVGDCVKRSLAFSLQLPYKDIAKELRSIQKEFGVSLWNIPIVYETLLSRHNIEISKKIYEGNVDQFQKTYSQGTYIVACGKSGIKPEHLTCVMNGDIYDSWDCQDYKVVQYYKIDSQGFAVNKDFDVTNIAQEVYNFAYDKIVQALYACKINENDIDIGDVYKESKTNMSFKVSVFDNLSIDFVYNFNPSFSKEDCIKYYKTETLKYVNKLLIKCKKFVKFFNIINTKLPIKFQRLAQSYFNNTKIQQIILGMPEKLYSNLVDISNYYNSQIDVCCEQLPDDPRFEKDSGVLFTAETAKEIIQQMEWYVENYRRVNYDY